MKPRVIGIDARTFYYSESTSRGIGHYSFYHLMDIVRVLPTVKFILFVESLDFPKSLKALIDAPNVSLKKVDEYNSSDIDLFHICDPMNNLTGFDSPIRIYRHPLTTVTFHDLIPLRVYLSQWPQVHQNAYLSRLEQYLRSDCSFLTNSEFTKKDLVSYGKISENRVTAIMAGPNRPLVTPIDKEKRTFEQLCVKFGISKSFFLHVGAHDPHKNFKNAYHAFAACQQSCDIQFVIVGKRDRYIEANAKYASEMNLHDLIFTGFVSREELEVLYRESIALLFLSKYEGFGFPILEAMANGCPVITSNMTSIPEVAGDAAFTLHPEDIPAISSAMQELFNNPEKRDEMRSKGYKQSAKFCWEKTARKTIAVWEQMLGSSLTNDRELVWYAPFLNPSGYTSEAFAFIQALRPYFAIQLGNISNIKSQDFILGLTPELQDILESSLHADIQVDNKILIIHVPAYAFVRPPEASYVIGRTMFETDSLPNNWVEACSQLDEIWVPSRFNKETFRMAGVPEEKIRIVHEPVDTVFFDPELCSPMALDGKAGFNFLSMFVWSARKGWDVLLQAYFSEFNRDDDVCLFIKTYLMHTPDVDVHAILLKKIREFAIDQGFELHNLPRYELITHQIPYRELPAFYHTFDCFVVPSRGEGWGRPFCEAMSMGLPVIGTNWSGNTEYMSNDNSFLIPIDGLTEADDTEIRYFKGHRWALPSIIGLQRIMREVFSNPEKARNRGKQARNDMVKYYSCNVIGKHLSTILRNIKPPVDTDRRDTSRIVWQGSQFVYHSLALVNRELCQRLIQIGHELSIVPYEADDFSPEPTSPLAANKQCINRPLSQPADVVVRHQWPPDFNSPPAGHWVMIQPWEFGSLPMSWIEPMNDKLDEIWVPSSYVRECYIQSGVRPDKVFVVPNGVDTALYSPFGASYPIASRKSFRFLFVGGTLHRKGIDLLLEAYRHSFTAQDDVCLVIKDMGGKSFYKGQTAQEMIQQFSADPAAPEIVYIDSELTSDEMAALYRSCHCLVHPYRGEGFGLPIAEAMASGLPVIVTGYGAALDFCPPEIAWLVPAQEVRFANCRVGDLDTVGPPWLAEPNLDVLSDRMQHAFAHPDEALRRGRVACEHIQSHFTWDHAAQCVEARLQALNAKPVVRFTKAKITPRAGDTTDSPANYEATQRDLASRGMEQARVLQMRGETEAAVTMLIQQGIGVAVDWPAPYLALAELLMREQKFAAAMQVVPEMPPATERTVMREIEAICHCALGDDEAAQKAANQAPERPRALVVLGTLAARRGDLSEAETFIRRAIEVDSSCSSAWLSLGMLLWGLGNQEDAWQAIKRSVMVDPLNGEAVRILKDMAERLERISEVTELIDEVAKTFPESRDLYRICNDGKNHD